MRGRDFKLLIEQGMQRHHHYLTLNAEGILLNFTDKLENGRRYDLFSCMAELLLCADSHCGPMLADLLKTVDDRTELLAAHTLSGIGYYFSDHLKKERSLAHFREKDAG